MDMGQKILDTQNRMNTAIENGEGEYANQLNDLLQALRAQNTLINQINDEMNEVTLQQAYTAATYTNGLGEERALSDMSISELKNLGVDKILEIYGQAAQDAGLIGHSVLDENGNLTQAGYDYLLPKLKAQGDSEIGAVLSGEAYTLNEALDLKNKFPNSIYVDRLLQNFASSLNTTVEGLGDLSTALGSLTLAETYMSTMELSDKIGSYDSLLESIATGAGKTSEWMTTIINQFPDLIAYMGDMSTLFDKINEKYVALSKQYINAQYSEISASKEYYNTIKQDFYKNIGGLENGEQLISMLDKAGVNSISQVTDWIRSSALKDDGTLNDDAQAILDMLTKTVDDWELSITSSILKERYDKIIEFRTKTLDSEIKNLNEQKAALQDINKQREYENQLIEAKLKLENASKEKKRVYRAGVGWVYESDQGAIVQAQNAYDSLQNQKTVSDLEMQIANLENEKNRLSAIYDEQNYETLSEFYSSYMKTSDDSLSFYSQMVDGLNGISTSVSELIEDTVEKDQENKNAKLTSLKAAWTNLQQSHTNGNYDTALEAYHNALTEAKSAGVTEKDTAG